MLPNVHEAFKKRFKSYIKAIPKAQITPIIRDGYIKYFNSNPFTITSCEQNFGMASFSTYPVINGIKQGEPNCDYSGILQLHNSQITAICDGCGWGSASCLAAQSALHGLCKCVEDNISGCKTLRDVATILVRAVECAHNNIFSNDKQTTATTTLISSITLQSEGKLYALVISIGDCQSFLFNTKTSTTTPVNDKWSRNICEVNDCGGWIGYSAKGVPNLKGCFLKLLEVKEGDIILLMSDGLSDNLNEFDPPHSSVCDLLSSTLKASTSLGNFVYQMTHFVIEKTNETRMFHQTHTCKRKDTLKGKLDHVTLIASRVKACYENTHDINEIISEEIKTIYPSKSDFKRPNSVSYSHEKMEDVQRTFSNPSSSEFTHFYPSLSESSVLPTHLCVGSNVISIEKKMFGHSADPSPDFHNVHMTITESPSPLPRKKFRNSFINLFH
ncbi:hypothetical protein EIN_374840 [Entamoeba invadens IP1]|uniref:PPM-type phosphatase domain-containing protein n=1 Tax=Entamoeba invadens IP1 TaxID=370355 RepID=A0A0A1TU51_ENTIV|nr:hypothetical protein EIN_374840 [Entamoeba invadens IP1]ELP83429.1 hypothetical protein EIN_374840 [Entamoeba invadens IP1]|eukprot:XP_004182775.1 hypothetical protein EIN_374840 [Entamoeba invadens IP1]